ncbi:carboxypeptidase regulatory-like domain-containing protein [Deinococcus sp. 6YEL10]|uniref:carboxypeptidase-like regulatory domain-containing protein n=1 Tax=Deinococcus sp. 6YEL10 TaxID=2745870 RepID=UPI001E53C18C|nr:carboxypeptidase-like regulatory domain-containing protein [Deinococcus sp. 6YEL10]MCD0159722.1 carboxypeptidase regulatory-like domain-containing protein [Deinococcus sp. 6YEL10]
MQLEERWASWTLEKDLDGGTAVLRIRSVIGYYRDKDTPAERWINVDERWLNVHGTAFTLTSQITPKLLGGSSSTPLVDIIEGVVYGLLGGAIDIRASTTLKITDADGQPVSGVRFALVDALGVPVANGTTSDGTTVLTTDAALGCRLTLEADGFEPQTVTVSRLQGEREIAVTLVRLPEPEPEPEPESVTED